MSAVFLVTCFYCTSLRLHTNHLTTDQGPIAQLDRAIGPQGRRRDDKFCVMQVLHVFDLECLVEHFIPRTKPFRKTSRPCAVFCLQKLARSSVLNT